MLIFSVLFHLIKFKIANNIYFLFEKIIFFYLFIYAFFKIFYNQYSNYRLKVSNIQYLHYFPEFINIIITIKFY